MNKKTIILLTIIVFAINNCTGCSFINKKSSNSKQEIMQAVDDTVKTHENDKNTIEEDLIEMRHWKYAKGPPSTSELEAADDTDVVTIQLLTDEQMDLIVEKLVNLGYLEKAEISEQEFTDALREFQIDNKLNCSGVLDTDTLYLLKGE